MVPEDGVGVTYRVPKGGLVSQKGVVVARRVSLFCEGTEKVVPGASAVRVTGRVPKEVIHTSGVDIAGPRTKERIEVAAGSSCVVAKVIVVPFGRQRLAASDQAEPDAPDPFRQNPSAPDLEPA